jgi:hypothetical protein
LPLTKTCGCIKSNI